MFKLSEYGKQEHPPQAPTHQKDVLHLLQTTRFALGSNARIMMGQFGPGQNLKMETSPSWKIRSDLDDIDVGDYKIWKVQEKKKTVPQTVKITVRFRDGTNSLWVIFL